MTDADCNLSEASSFSLKEVIRLGVVLIGISFLPFIIFHLFIIPKSQTDSIFKSILKDGKIRFLIIAPQSTMHYYDGTGSVLVFERELAEAFAAAHQIELEVVTVPSRSDLKAYLAPEREGKGAENGKVNIIAGLSENDLINVPDLLISDSYRYLSYNIVTNQEDLDIKDLKGLNDRSIRITDDIPYLPLSKQLQQKGYPLSLSISEGLTRDTLLHEVGRGQVQFAIADIYSITHNMRHYPNLKISLPVYEQPFYWAMAPKAKELQKQVNAFFKNANAQGVLTALTEQYLMPLETFDYVDTVVFNRRLSTRLPKYIEIIKAAADENCFDWRLIVAQIYQESHFNKWAESQAQAYGLMQLTRSTARKLGVKNIINPRQNITAGVRQLRELYDFYDKAEGYDRLLISLAAYNIGIGHILDARNLARQTALDPDKWTSLLETLPLLEQPEYYENAKYGYCKGREAVSYVKQIMFYYDILKHKKDETYLAAN